MDILNFQKKIKETIIKYKFVLIVILCGVFMMALPGRKTDSSISEPEFQEIPEVMLEQELEKILSRLEGAGKVDVLLTEYEGERVLYQSDEDRSINDIDESIRRSTVIVSGESREEQGLIRQINPPIYKGAVILCQGADSASVRLSIVEAVSNATGLSTDRITVLKMK